MKQYIPLSLLGLLTLSVSAGQLDLQSISSLRRYTLGSEQNARHLKLKMPAQPSRGLAFATVAPGHDIADLEAEGAKIVSVIGDVAIVEVEMAHVAEIAASPCVGSMQLQRPVGLTTDRARADQQIDAIQLKPQQVGLGRAYTGKNVIAGIVDAGFDPHHINFRYANGESRVGYLAWLRTNNAGTGIAEDHFNYTNISGFITDSPYQYHATHTAGIMAGSYNGPVKIATADGTGTEDVDVCPYYGIAPEADLAVACGETYDVMIARGMECLLNYSQWEERPLPLVINMSLGSTSGARDERSLMSRVINTIAEEAVVCISAGNEGDLKLAANKTFGEEDNTFRTMIYPYKYQGTLADPNSNTLRQGSVEVWGSDDRPFKLKAVIYNKKRGFRTTLNLPVLGDNIGTYYVSSAEYQVSTEDVVGDPTLCKAYEGYIGVGAKLDEDTGRYYGMVDYYLINNVDTNFEDDYVLGFEVEGEAGQRIDCYCDGTTTWLDSYGAEGFADGSTNGTISDMAVASNAISVGSYNTRNTWPVLAGGQLMYEGDGFVPGRVSGFSSYGTLPDGRNLPLICAPGSTLISSVSWPYAKNLTDAEIQGTCSAILREDNRTNLWKQEAGTSMAAPFVSGSIALWLEANPKLTPADVRDIIARTAIQDEDVAKGDPVQWGAGKFNALGGLKEAIRMSSIEGVADGGHNDRLLTERRGDKLNIFVGGADKLDIKFYTTDGRCVMTRTEIGDEADVDMASMSRGIYILNVNGRHSQKIIN